MYIAEHSCQTPDDCNGKGLCPNSTCLCNQGWQEKADCSGNKN